MFVVIFQFKSLLNLFEHRHVAHFEAVLGTALEVQITAGSRGAALKAETALLTEIDRLELVFSRFNPVSELNRWQTKMRQPVAVSNDLRVVLESALRWQTWSGGAFHPGADALSRLWQGAARASVAPSKDQIAAILETLQQPLYEVSSGSATRLSAAPLNFNAFAKGYIVDCATRAAKESAGVSSVLVNIGGDLRHIGAGAVTVGIANPASNADNLEPLCQIRVTSGGVASSGQSQRGVRIAGQWYSHVIDPRTGHPVEHVIGASVIAPTSATADVLATVFGVLEPRESLALARGLPDVGLLIVAQNGAVTRNEVWERCEVFTKSS